MNIQYNSVLGYGHPPTLRDLGLGVDEFRRQLEVVRNALADAPQLSEQLAALGVPSLLTSFGSLLDRTERFCNVYDAIAVDTHEDLIG